MIILNPAIKKRRKTMSLAAKRRRFGRSSAAVGASVKTKRPRRKHVGRRRRVNLGRSYDGTFSSSFFSTPVQARCGLKRGGWQMHRSKAGKFSQRGRLAGCFKNPGLLKSVTAGYKPGALGNALPIALGMIINDKLSSFIGNKTGWNDGLKGVVVSLGSAGVTLLVPGYGPRLFLGGVAKVLIDWLLPFVQSWTETPALPAQPALPPVSAAQSALPAPGMSDAGSRGSGAANPEDAEEFEVDASESAWPTNAMNDLPVESSTEDVE